MEKQFTDLAASLQVNGKDHSFFSLPRLAENLGIDLFRLPFSLRILLEGCLRQQDKGGFSREAIEALVTWKADDTGERSASFTHGVLPADFRPARIE
jgi:aconitate hydratase